MDQYLELLDLVGVLARRRYVTAERNLPALGFNHTEARVLTLLHQEGGVSQDELSGMIFIDRSNVGRALKTLEQGKYIIRRKDEADKRTNIVQMTAKGRKAVSRIEKLRLEMARNFFGDLKKEDAGLIVELLKKAMKDL